MLSHKNPCYTIRDGKDAVSGQKARRSGAGPAVFAGVFAKAAGRAFEEQFVRPAPDFTSGFSSAVMTLFLSTHHNKVDKKGRVSVPSQFRTELANESFQGIVVFRSNVHPALEGFAYSYMQEIAGRLDNFDMFSEEQDDLATALFGEAVQLPFDGDGRIVLPVELMEFAGIVEKAAFVGLGGKFQIWDPDLLEKRREDARRNVRDKNMTLPKGGKA